MGRDPLIMSYFDNIDNGTSNKFKKMKNEKEFIVLLFNL
jgi:hypothetical protein